MSTITTTDDLQVAVLTIAGEAYAVPIASIKEIVPYERPRPLHDAPAHVVGVIGLRGTVLPVTDLAVLLDGGAAATGERTTVVFELAHGSVGGIVDEVTQVATLRPEEIEPADSLGELASEAVAGIVRRDDSLAVLLDVEALLGGTAGPRG